MEQTETEFELNINLLRKDFPLLADTMNGKPLVYFDNGATTQKPKVVIDRIAEYYKHENANVHRGVYTLSAIATDEYEKARETVRRFLNAKSAAEIIFTKGTTESINLAATILCRSGKLKDGDEVIVSEMEHHANIVPWQISCGDKKIILKVLPFDENGELRLDELDKLISSKTKMISVVHVSNTLGSINDVRRIIDFAKTKNILTLVDGAQAVSHLKIDVQKLGCDFYTFSGHKIFAPTGVGVLYGKEDLLNELSPYQGGGEMIDKVTFEKTTFNRLPYKFEAGTPNISGVLGLAAALNYFTALNLQHISDYEEKLTEYALNEFSKRKDVKLLGRADKRVPVFSFVVDGVHHYDIGTLLDTKGIASRTGHHCTQPTMDHFGVSGTTRISLSFYNTIEELEIFFNQLDKIIKMLK
jgi:cysteine desulfurase/selenocysteine lyase